MGKKSNLLLLRKAIKDAGSQAKLAARIGCGQQTLSDLLNGKRRMSGDMAVLIEAGTGISRHQLRPDLFGAAQ
jgi:DNA-binding transcriptional regulator YdaS (Cro superfamily)